MMFGEGKGMVKSEIREKLFSLADKKYKSFSKGLLPTLDDDRLIGVRLPILRKIATEIINGGNSEDYLSALPHSYHEENMLCAFLIMELEYEKCIAELNRFLPFVDNWAVCDSLRPKCFSKNKDLLLPEIRTWLKSEHTYTARFAIECLMLHYLDTDFSPEMPEWLLSFRSGDYYLDMMVAWYFATALAVRYDDVISYLVERRLPIWIHNKTISKASESLRISEDKKAYLKTLRIKRKERNE